MPVPVQSPRAAAALRSPQLQEALENYECAFDEYLNHFYSGLNALAMLKILIGSEAFRAGMDLYLRRCDGTAATVEEFLACFAEASGRDLSHFALWYRQAGTPSLMAKGFTT